MPSLTQVITIFFLSLAFTGFVTAVIRKLSLSLRPFTQLSLFMAGWMIGLCNRGLPCQNCPFSFGFCPIGTSQRIAFFKTFPVYLALIFIALIGAVFGAMGCGWVCPGGFIQDNLHALCPREFRISIKLKRLRLAALLLVIILIYLELAFNIFSSRGVIISHDDLITILVVDLFLILALFAKRPFCRFLCPLGFIYGKMNKIAPARVNLDIEKCLKCGNCRKVCPVGLKPNEEVNTELCIKCFNCAKACPRLAKAAANN
ncbi:MAG: 4Fe-4S binding protein [Candidatus Omnitrophota bacterium]